MGRDSPTYARLVPELDVSDLDASLRFYTDVCGFDLRYRREDERFAYLDLGGANLMLQAADGPGRRFRTAPLEKPYGRGINLQIQVDKVDQISERVLASDAEIVLPLEDSWYAMPTAHVCNRQFVVADPDGYLLRFFEDLGDASQTKLVEVDEVVLERLAEAAVTDAAPDEVTPPIVQGPGAGTDWTTERTKWLKAFHQDRRPGLDGPLGEATYAIVAAGKISGSVRLKRMADPSSLELGIWLTRSARGLGIGTVAVAETVQIGREAGYRNLRAETRAGNAPALRILRSHGFHLSRPTADGTVEATLVMDATPSEHC